MDRTILSVNKVIFLSFLCLFLVSCNKDDVTVNIDDDDIIDNVDEVILNKETLLFQMEQVNFGFGFVHKGWYINNEGEIRVYNRPSDWNNADDSGYFEQDDLHHNYKQADNIVDNVDLDELIEKSKLIDNVLDGELSERDCPGADLGSISLYCYSWNEEKKKYRQQFLSMSGDCLQFNTSEEAKELVVFLNNYIH